MLFPPDPGVIIHPAHRSHALHDYTGTHIPREPEPTPETVQGDWRAILGQEHFVPEPKPVKAKPKAKPGKRIYTSELGKLMDNRSPHTIREWIDREWLPQPRTNGKEGLRFRRYWTQAEARQIVITAKQCGVWSKDSRDSISASHFPVIVRTRLQGVTEDEG